MRELGLGIQSLVREGSSALRCPRHWQYPVRDTDSTRHSRGRADYQIEAGPDGKPFTKTAQVRRCGNSVCPPLAEGLIRANFAHEAQIYGRAAA